MSNYVTDGSLASKCFITPQDASLRERKVWRVFTWQTCDIKLQKKAKYIYANVGRSVRVDAYKYNKSIKITLTTPFWISQIPFGAHPFLQSNVWQGRMPSLMEFSRAFRTFSSRVPKTGCVLMKSMTFGISCKGDWRDSFFRSAYQYKSSCIGKLMNY